MNQKCIYVNLSLMDNIGRENYVGDISEVLLNMDFIRQETPDPFDELPTPFFSRFVKNKKISGLFGGNDIDFTFCKIDIPSVYGENNIIYILYERLPEWNIQGAISQIKKYGYGNPRATQICKRHKILGPAVFFHKDGKDIGKPEFIENWLKKSWLKSITISESDFISGTPKNDIERYNVAQDYLKKIIELNLISYEDGYILFGTQIKQKYVIEGSPWVQGGPCFHSIHVRANMILNITGGSTIRANVSSDANYLWEIQNVNTILPENIDEISTKIESYNKLKKLPRIQFITYEEEKLRLKRINKSNGRRRRRHRKRN